MNGDTLSKQNEHQQQEIANYEQTLAQLRGSLEKTQAQLKTTHTNMVESQQSEHDLKAQLHGLQANHSETVDQLGDRTKTSVSLKAELDRLNQQNTQMAHEVGSASGQFLMYSLRIRFLAHLELMTYWDQEVVLILLGLSSIILFL